MNKDHNHDHNHDHHDHNHEHEHVHDCDCGDPNHDHGQEEYDTIVLTLDDDTELECIVLDVFEVDNRPYIALVSIEEEQVLIYRYIEVEDGEDDEFTLDTIDDEAEFERVSQAFNELFIEDIEEADTWEETPRDPEV